MVEKTQTLNDIERLHLYAESSDERAFTELVKRYGGMVHGVAIRVLRDEDAAKDVSQTVFLALAKNARVVRNTDHLAAWLHRVATWEARRALKKKISEQRTMARAKDHQETQNEGRGLWETMSPFFDEAFEKLKLKDREILSLHYLEGMQFRKIARHLGISPDAAQKRSVRAVGKLSSLLKKRGIVVPVITLASCLGTDLAHTMPIGLSQKVVPKMLKVTTTPQGVGAIFTQIMMVMQANKLIAMSSIILGALFPVGWQTVFPNENPAADRKLSISTPIQEKDASLKAGGRGLSETERLRMLFREIDESPISNQEIIRQLKQLIFILNEGELKVAVEMLGEVENHQRFSSVAEAVFACWAEVDPEVAMQEALKKKNGLLGRCLDGAFTTWTALDPEPAMHWLTTDKTQFDHRLWVIGWLERLLKRDPFLAVGRMEAILEIRPEWAETVEGYFIEAWNVRDRSQALDWVTNQEEGKERDTRLAYLLGDSKRVPFLEAIELVEEMTLPEGRQDALRDLLQEWQELRLEELKQEFQTVLAGAQLESTRKQIRETLAHLTGKGSQ